MWNLQTDIYSLLLDMIALKSRLGRLHEVMITLLSNFVMRLISISQSQNRPDFRQYYWSENRLPFFWGGGLQYFNRNIFHLN